MTTRFYFCIFFHKILQLMLHFKVTKNIKIKNYKNNLRKAQ